MVDRQWLAKCATAGEFLYGHYTVTVLKKMYQKKKGCKISTDELISTMKELEADGEILMEYFRGRLEDDDDDLGFFVPVECEGTSLEAGMRKADEEGNPYASLHIDENERIDLVADMPDGLTYYIPSPAEIAQLVDEGYISSPEMSKLEYQVRKHGGDPEGLKALWGQISTGKLDQTESVNAVLDIVCPGAPDGGKDEETAGEKREKAPSLDELRSLISYVNDFINNVNCRARKGWRPHELFKKMYPNGLTEMPTIMPGSVKAAKVFKGAESQLKDMGVKVDYSSIDNFVGTGSRGERKVTKVGRNDPCPCGSGKKYKRCHGR